MKRGVFFDLYGTLFVYGDLKKACADWHHHFYISLRYYGLDLSEEEFARECETNFWTDKPALNEPNLTVFENYIKSFCVSHDITVIDESVSSIADLIAGKWQESISVDPDAVPVLKKLKEEGMILGLISNFDHPRHLRKHIIKNGLKHFFETIIISGEAGVKKPNPEILAPALCETGLEPDEVVYVGDSEVDIEAALAAGVMPILIDRQSKEIDDALCFIDRDSSHGRQSDTFHSEKSCKTISSLKEVLALL